MGAGEVVDWSSDGNVMDRAGVAEVVDVKDQNAEQGDTAEHVDARDTVGADCGGDCCDGTRDLLIEGKSVAFCGDWHGH